MDMITSRYTYSDEGTHPLLSRAPTLPAFPAGNAGT